MLAIALSLGMIGVMIAALTILDAHKPAPVLAQLRSPMDNTCGEVWNVYVQGGNLGKMFHTGHATGVMSALGLGRECNVPSRWGR
jgi:hypothetical protein